MFGPYEGNGGQWEVGHLICEMQGISSYVKGYMGYRGYKSIQGDIMDIGHIGDIEE